MEVNNNDSSSENDRKMMGSFEKFDDKGDEKNEKKKKSKNKTPRIFEKADEDEKPEKRGNTIEPKKPEKSETKPESEEGNLEKLSSDEEIVVAAELINQEKLAVEEEQQIAPEGSVDKAEADGAALFLENLEDELRGAETLDQALDEAEVRTKEEMGLVDESEPLEEDTTDEENEAPFSGTATSGSAPPRAGHAGAPPPPPRVPSPSMVAMPGPIPSPNNSASLSPNAVPLASNPNVLPTSHNRGPDLLIGGVIGYMIGRRRGRINTEERLVPVQKKLEQEVIGLHAKITERENKIRNLAAEQITHVPEVVQMPASENVTRNSEKHIDEKTASRQEIIKDTYSKPVVERLGSVIIPKLETISPEAKKDPATLTTAELLEIAGNIKVEGMSVKAIYESKRLDAVGLRRVVLEYMRGGNHERLLAEAMVAISSPERLTSTQHQADSPISGGATANESNVLPATQFHTTASTEPRRQPDFPASQLIHTRQSLKQQVKSKLITIIVAAMVLFLVLVAFV